MTTTDIVITVTRKGVDTGIWHIGTDANDLIEKAKQSISDAFGDGKRVIRVAGRDRDNTTGTLVINHTGANYRWSIITDQELRAERGFGARWNG